ncbi:phage tail sheath subtilisin-like domain-containing protein [Phenylobacterium immobile]|uniref:phage tail sheath subtilisin-like domain-containing protein n=1 Tax=Phenylobacterium immobile TaxID=21 RepID=UPI000A6DC54D|nr:phage tail sheath subtilisin-like domain-containing protein [Phenylobacterium immobile]
MSSTLATRLPGVRVTAAPAQAPEALPRMDICVFIGLASRGPLQLPVAVEDKVEFAAIFGADAPLAWDNSVGAPAKALLGPAVRAFFANGGRRCWIVRVADASAAYNRIDLPGVIAVGGDEPLQAQLRARSAGSWADRLTLSLAPQATSQPLLSADVFAAEPRIEATAATAPAAGELLAFTWTGAGGLETARLHAVATIDESPAASGVVRRRLRPVLWSALAQAEPAAGVEASGLTLSPCAAILTVSDEAKLILPASAETPRAGEILNLLRPDGQRGWILATAVVGEDMRTTVTGPLRWEIVPATPPAGTLRCDRITLDLSALGPGLKTCELGFGASAQGPRYLGALPTDDARYGYQPPSSTGTSAPGLAGGPLGASALPLAGLDGESRVFVPLFDAEDLPAPAGHDGRAALARDGLSTFDAGLFIDTDVAAVAVDQVVSTADYLRYRAPTIRRLRGAHVALGIDESAVLDEATLIACPDAVLPAWRPSAEADFVVRPLVIAGEPDPCAVESAFADCSICTVSIEALHATLGVAGEVDLFWRASDPNAVCVVEAASREDFDGASEIYRGPAGACTARAPLEQEIFWRVRAEVPGENCGWAAAIAVIVRDRRGFAMDAAADGHALVEVQQAILRICAARGDLMAVLSLPATFGADDAIDHAAKLQRLRPGEERALSYGALYHPWVVSLDSPAGIETTPPDGPMAGVMAARAIRRGAWIAPANEPLQKALALTPAMPPGRKIDLAEAGVNTLSREARGFLQMGAETLSLDPELRQINVRRLLILIRRLAMRHGVRYVFEPNDAALRRTVERVFEGHLGDLFQRGAFSGAKPETAFQVDCGPALNTPQGVEAGRFVVELRVAPSLPMRFLTVRLTQSAGALAVTEGRS